MTFTDQQIQQKIDLKTKPIGALGQLESLAKQIALVQQKDTVSINKASMLIFAGDHGIAKHGISIAPSEVTTQMVQNFLHGGAAINCLSRTLGWHLNIIDCGILTKLNHPELINQRLGESTNDISTSAAMTLKQVETGFTYSESLIYKLHSDGCNTIGLGEMGIGNTAAASAICAAILQKPALELVGKGTGINDEQLKLKSELVQKALDRSDSQDPIDILLNLGGFEIVQLVGAILSAAKNKMLIIIDGFIVTSAALVALKINPDIKQFLIFAHNSQEQAHKKVLEYLNVKALLDLNLRLGEGSGAALALPLLQSSVSFYNDMASLSDLGIEI